MRKVWQQGKSIVTFDTAWGFGQMVITIAVVREFMPYLQLFLSDLQFSSAAYVWGAGDGGQLGTGTQEQKTRPVKLEIEAEVMWLLC